MHIICMKKLNNYTRTRTCVYNINYHIVWCIKYRNKVLTQEVSERLYEILRHIGETNGFTVRSVKTGQMDHVHCFVEAPPKLSVTVIVKHLKGTSAITLFREFPELRKSLYHGELWNGSYFVETIGSTSEENVFLYIDRQKDYPR